MLGLLRCFNSAVGWILRYKAVRLTGVSLWQGIAEEDEVPSR